MSNYDAIVIGGGPGGTAAAEYLNQHGKKVAVVEDTGMGGTCTNRGCIPTKFLLAAIAPIGALKNQSKYKVLDGELKLDYQALKRRRDRFTNGTSAAVAKGLEDSGIKIYKGRGVISAPGKVKVEGEDAAELSATDIIIATGSVSASFPGLEPDNEAILDSTMVLELEEIPESLLVVGAGAIGMEFSDFFATLGCETTIIEGIPQLIPTEDADIAKEYEKAVKRSGRKCITGAMVKSLETKDGKAHLTLADGSEHVAEKALVAVGRRANTKGLGVEEGGGKLDKRGFVQVDENLMSGDNLYAVGDVSGLALLAHTAEHQGEYVARKILGMVDGPYNSGPVPACVFGSPEVMRVGKTARDVAKAGGKPMVSTVPMSMNAIAQANANNTGMAKAVWDGDELVGMAAVGVSAAHLITAAQLLVMTKQTPEKMHDFMFCHPTLDEILKLALKAPRVEHQE